MSRVYLDHNATMPLRSEARDAMIAAMDVVGNPSSVHAEGRATKGVIERARRQVAEASGCNSDQVIFTSGATESVSAIAYSTFSQFSISCASIEHDAVNVHRSHDLRLNVGANGRIELDPYFDVEILGALSGGRDDVIAIQAANSETGVCQDLSGLVGYIRERAPKATVLCDAVQAFGKVPMAFSWMNVDAAVLSAHKLGGPKGVGAILAQQNVQERLESDPLVTGGGQEMGRRSGTENVIGIAGFGAAAEAAQRELDAGVWDRVKKLRKILESAIEAEASQTILVGQDVDRLPNTLCFATPGWKGETQVMAMDLAGFAISAGSACSSGKVRASRVLTAMGHDEVTAASAVRVSLGPQTTEEEVLRFAEAWCRAEKKFRAKAA